MGEGKNIQIKIAATGGAEAAAEIKKVETAGEAVAVSNVKITDTTKRNTDAVEENRKAFAAWQAERNAARGQATTGMASEIRDPIPIGPAAVPFSQHGGIEATTEKLEQFARTGNRVTASAASMRFGLQNVGYQIQDIAVQAEMGTPALRIMGQQMPQLLGGFGLWGVAAGAAIAIGAPLIASFTNTGEAAKKAKKDTEDLTSTMDAYKESAEDAVQARSVADLTEWFKALDDEEEKIQRNNSSLEKSIELETKLRVLKSGVEAARRDLAIANIESDPNLSDAEKTRQVAEFKEKDEREKAKAKISGLRGESDSAARGYDAAQQTADRQAADAEAARIKREEIEAEQAAAAERARIASEDIPKIQKRIKDAEKSQRFAVNPETGATTPAYDDYQKKIDADKEALEAAKKASGGDLTGAQRKEKQEADAKLVAAAKAKEEEQKKQAEAAREAAEKAYSEKLQKEAAVREQEPLIVEQYQTEAQGRAVRTETKAAKQEADALKKAEDEKKKTAKKDAADKRKDDAESKRRGNARRDRDVTGPGIAKSLADSLEDSGESADKIAYVQKLGLELARPGDGSKMGTDSQLLDKIVTILEGLVRDKVKGGEGMGDDAQKYRALKNKVDILEGRISNTRTGK